MAIIGRGVDVAYPKLRIASNLSDRGKELYPLTLSLCIPEINSDDSEFAKTAPNALFKPGTDLGTLIDALADNDPTDLRVRAPLLVLQGTSDATVLPNFTTAMVAGLRKRDAKVTYKTYENVDHTFIAFGAPQDDAFAWVSKRMK